MTDGEEGMRDKDTEGLGFPLNLSRFDLSGWPYPGSCPGTWSPQVMGEVLANDP